MGSIPIRRYVSSALQSFQKVKNASSYQYGCVLFWSAVGIVSAAVIGVILIEAGNSIRSLSFLIQEPSNDFFGSSLTLILSIISLVFIVVIFLVQNANQAYSTRLSGVILRDQYFLATIGFVLAGSIFSISGSYFDLGAPFTLVGYAFSVATVLLVGALIAFAGYFINIANIIEYITRQIEDNISTDQIYRPNPFSVQIQDEEYIGRLTSQTQLIVSTCIKAIEQNQQPVVDSCLDALIRITERFLAETTERDVDEDYLQELNDQFQFIGSVAFEEYTRQKYSESVVEAIGNIGIEITKAREIGTLGSSWASLLGDLFQDSLKFDRTAAASISIQKLGEMCISAIKQGDFDSVRIYQGELETVSTICTAGNHPYLANLLQTLQGQYQKMYAAYLYALLSEGYVPDYDVSQLLEEFAGSFNEGKSAYGYYNKQILFAGLFGLQPFAGTVAAPLLRYPDPDPRTQRHLQEYLEGLVNFLREVSLTEIDENHSDLYKGYTQFLFVFEKAEPLDTDANGELVSQLNDAWLQLVIETYRQAIDTEENVDHNLNERMSDFTAFLVYFYRSDPDTLADLLEPYAEIYRELSESYTGQNQYADRTLEDFYKQLKLIGAWVNRFHDPQSVTPQLWEVLIEEFHEIPDTESLVPRQLMARYGYPITTSLPFYDGWWLRPDNLWSHTGFQDEITDCLNGDDGSNYAKFHERLENEQ